MLFRRGSRGSAIVEAAMVFPLVILIVFGVIFTGLNMYGSVRDDAATHKEAATEEKNIYPEDILRASWLMKRGFADETKE